MPPYEQKTEGTLYPLDSGAAMDRLYPALVIAQVLVLLDGFVRLAQPFAWRSGRDQTPVHA